MIRRVLKEGIPRDVLVNINFPDCAPGAVKGVAVTSQGKRDQELLRIEARHDGRGQSVLLDRVRAQASGRAGATAPTCRRSTTTAFRSRRCGSTSPTSRS